MCVNVIDEHGGIRQYVFRYKKLKSIFCILCLCMGHCQPQCLFLDNIPAATDDTKGDDDQNNRGDTCAGGT